MLSSENHGLEHELRPLYADVIVPRHIAKSFTYLVPGALAPIIAVGHRVLIPFGRTTIEGAVVALDHRLPSGVQAGRLKQIRSLAEARPTIPPTLFQLSRMIADVYLAPWGQCLRLVLPPGRIAAAPPSRYVATDQGRAALRTEVCPEHLRLLLARIARRATGVLASSLADARVPTVRQALEELQTQGWITTHAVTSPSAAGHARSAPERKDFSALPPVSVQVPAGPEPDAQWTHRVSESLRAAAPDRMLVHAPLRNRLGLLIRAIQQVAGMKKSALVLVGEVALAEWLGRLIATATKLPVVLLHSDLDEATRTERWELAQGGGPTIVVGTRSALFTPLPSLGLIWLDGEESPALKEPQEPRYHTRDVAWMRAQAERAVLILGSSHPSLESYWAAGVRSLRTPESDTDRPRTETVDLRREPGGSLFSSQLLAAVRETLERKDRVLLFLNRKGFAGALVCRECGWVPRCPACAVACTYYRQSIRLSCRYCGDAAVLPDACPGCGGARFTPVGEGTERVETEARRLFPAARIVRLDGDSLRQAAAGRRLWETALSGDWDVLIGTQVLFQREPLPSVALAGIVQADSGMSIPDFRAAERTYQLLGDAIDLVRPAASGGRVILQTLLPAHHVIESLMTGNPSRFYEEELAARRLLGYPPALHLVVVSVSGKDPSTVERTARQLVEHLEKSVSGDTATGSKPLPNRAVHASTASPDTLHERLTVLGPVRTAGGTRHGHQRRQIMVKGRDRACLHEAVRAAVKAVEETVLSKRVKVVVDVDPVEMG